MKKVFVNLSTVFAFAVLPVVTSAQGLANGDAKGDQVGTFFEALLGFIDGVLIPVILGLAFLVFVWGVFQFFILGGSDEEAQSKGKSLMIYAVAGFVLIIAFYGIINLVTNGLGLQGQTIDVPTVPEPIN